MRARISLDGTWSFWPEIPGEPEEWRPIAVPGPWQAQFEDLRFFSGRARYERLVLVPQSWNGRVVRLCFGACDYLCEVFVNGSRAGAHEGGYLPFWFDVTELIRFGEANEVRVLVVDPGPGDVDPVVFDEIPHGKQSWYGPLGGLWQSAYLEAAGSTFVDRALITASLRSLAVSADVRLGSPSEDGAVLSYRLLSPAKTQTWEGRLELEPGVNDTRLELQLAGVEAWSPQTPALYQLELALSRRGELVDQWSDTFGFRSIETGDGVLLLNGEPLYLLGALDQDYYLDTIATPPSGHLLRRQVLLAKELGLNCLRCHIKVPDPRYLRAADELGILVWSELPNWNILTDAAKERARATFAGMVERDFNHPSIVIWSIANESWGLDLSDEAQRRWLEATYSWAKQLDPTRLVVDNSACEGNFHVHSDLNDYHLYRAFPDHARSWRAWTQAWASNPSSTYSPHGDAIRAGAEPLVLSEFGNWGLPEVSELLDRYGREPWWFETGAERGDGVALPQGVLQRFEDWGLAETFSSWQGLVGHSQDHQFDGLRESIYDLRSHPEIAGYVITEFTDVHWEANGLLDLGRKPKSYHHRFQSINAPDVVMLKPRHRRYWVGETVEVEVVVSHYSERDLGNFAVSWSLEGNTQGTLSGMVGRGAVVNADVISFEAPPVQRPGPLTLGAELRDARGRFVNRAEIDLPLFPPRQERREAVAVAEQWGEAASYVLAGGRALILARNEDALPPTAQIAIQARAGSRWEGDWAQGMSFLTPQIHESLGTGPRISCLFEGITADHVVTGFRPAHHSDLFAGCYLGWLRDLVALVGAFRAGRGCALVTTLRLDGAGRDPLATALLDRLVEIAASPALSPSTTLF